MKRTLNLLLGDRHIGVPASVKRNGWSARFRLACKYLKASG